MQKCEWQLDESSGDLVMVCCGNKEGARIPKKIMRFESEDYPQETRNRLMQLKKNVEVILDCNL